MYEEATIEEEELEPPPAPTPTKVKWNYQPRRQEKNEDNNDPEWSGLQFLAGAAFQGY